MGSHESLDNINEKGYVNYNTLYKYILILI